MLTNTVEVVTTLPGDGPSNNSDEWYTTAWPSVAIHDIQGAQHLSPYEGSFVLNVPGIVTGLYYNGFCLQDPFPHANDDTSEAIFAYTGGAPSIAVGDAIV
ncbi:MAG: hypothetical protein WA996_02325 [Candidatus Promineifilaceae bacterium]